MAAGTVTTIISLLSLAWAREIVQGIASIFNAPAYSKAVTDGIIAFAVFWVYVLDFSINTCKITREYFQQQTNQFIVQAGIRAFIVDNAPVHQQDEANAWASRLTGLASIFG
jgi:solute carrier family 45, member 1/2/4